MAKKLYVGNLSYDTTDDELNRLFSQCGQVSSAKVIKDKETGRSKGFGFVEMTNNDEATHAIERMQGYDLKGRPIKVDEAQEKPEGAVRRREDHSGGMRSSNRDGGGNRGGRR
jgi:cold-inducible RNA-binding protein